MKKCRLWFHDWGKWEEDTRGNITKNGRVIGIGIVQKRRCERCGLSQLREEITTKKVW